MDITGTLLGGAVDLVTVDFGGVTPCAGLEAAAACPGVVCFLEKTAPHALPFLSLFAFIRRHVGEACWIEHRGSGVGGW